MLCTSFNQFFILLNSSIDNTIQAYSSAEMSAFKPVGGGFVRHAAMWLDKSTGVAIGYVHSIPIYGSIHPCLGGIFGIL